MPGTPPGVQGTSETDARATSAGSSRCGGAAALLLPGDRAHLISKGAPRHPAEEAHFGRLYAGSYSFVHVPKFMAIDESRNVD